jgi:1-acyl-sn-glycerol-3-phosphate acyltransferase
VTPGAPFVLEEPRPAWEWAVGAVRLLGRAQACLGAIGTELLTVPPPTLSPVEEYREAARAAHRLARRLLEVQGVRVSIRGSVPSGPTVLVANHLGYLDPIVVGALLPCAAIAKSELASWPLVGRVARHVGTLFLRRGDPYDGALVLRRAFRRLVAGIPVLNFPEGTTTDGSSSVLPFHRGVFGLARRAGVPVVPVALRFDPAETAWVGGEAFLPHYAWMSARPAIEAQVRFGEPVDARAFRSAEACAAEVRERVETLLGGAR